MNKLCNFLPPLEHESIPHHLIYSHNYIKLSFPSLVANPFARHALPTHNETHLVSEPVDVSMSALGLELVRALDNSAKRTISCSRKRCFASPPNITRVIPRASAACHYAL